jgi:pilus assembly protein CpaE
VSGGRANTTNQIRLLLVEDVPQVAQYVRGLLTSQGNIKLLDVLADGRNVEGQVRELRPDVLIVDALLQGKVKGLQVAENVRRSGINVPTIVLTVPQTPVEINPGKGVDRVLKMPFSGYDLVNLLQSTMQEHMASTPEGASKIISVFSPKGGVGKSTMAFNLAVVFAQQGALKTVLVDGSIQYGDLRSLLKVPADAPSILDLPTDRIQESDLSDVLWRDPSGVDILLAPPRVEMAEMVTTRDIDKILSMLRRLYNVIVIDTSTQLTELVLSFLDASDVILEIITYESTTLHNARSIGDAFRAIGYPASKVQYLVNRSDSTGGIDPSAIPEILGREPEHAVVSDGRLVVEANNQGVPFVLANPAAQISQDLTRVAATLAGAAPPAPAGARR